MHSKGNSDHMIGRKITDARGIPLTNLADFLLTAMKKYGASTALVNAETGLALSYDDVIDRAERLAFGLRELGFSRGDTLGIMSYNSIELPVLYIATLLLGGTLQPLAPECTDADLERRFLESHTRVVVTTPDKGHRVARLADTLKSKHAASISNSTFIEKIVIMGTLDGFTSYHSLLGNGKVKDAEVVDPKTAVAILLSSSGTTGLPKTVQWSHHSVIADVIQMAAVYQHPTGSVCLTFLPMYHHFGALPVTFGGLFAGLRLVVMPRFNFEDYLKYIERYKVEILQLVPPIAVRLVKQSTSVSSDLSSVRAIDCGAAPLSRRVEELLLETFRLQYVGYGYGASEAGCLAGNTRTAFKPGSVGRATMFTTVKITDPDTNHVLGPNESGEILVKGPTVTIGYLNNPQATRAAIDSDGFFHTGDRGYLDDDGFLFVVDRYKELIKYKAFQVAPAELENILLKHPDVSDAAVVGIPDEYSGELPKAFVVRRNNSDVTAEDICTYVKGHVPSHSQLRGGVEFVAEIPKSPSGKILRRVLRQGPRRTSKL